MKTQIKIRDKSTCRWEVERSLGRGTKRSAWRERSSEGRESRGGVSWWRQAEPSHRFPSWSRRCSQQLLLWLPLLLLSFWIVLLSSLKKKKRRRLWEEQRRVAPLVVVAGGVVLASLSWFRISLLSALRFNLFCSVE